MTSAGLWLRHTCPSSISKARAWTEPSGKAFWPSEEAGVGCVGWLGTAAGQWSQAPGDVALLNPDFFGQGVSPGPGAQWRDSGTGTNSLPVFQTLPLLQSWGLPLSRYGGWAQGWGRRTLGWHKNNPIYLGFIGQQLLECVGAIEKWEESPLVWAEATKVRFQ